MKSYWDLQREAMEAAHAAQESDMAAKASGFGIGELGSVPETTTLDEIEAERLQPSPKANSRCDMCGTSVPKSWLHWSNYNGSVCPDCYDSLPEG